MDANADYPAGLSGRAVLVYSSVGHLMFHFMGVFFFTIVLALQVAWEVPYHDLIKMWAPAAILTAAAALPAGWLGDRTGRKPGPHYRCGRDAHAPRQRVSVPVLLE